MWINRDVNLPQALATAQREGRLVVLAGAGVSMGPPANLPSFEHLAVQIAGGALARRPTEPLDAYLGRVERHGINVQARARQFIDVQHDTGELFDLAAGALAGGADRDDVRRIAAEMLRLGLVDGESLRRMTDERQDGD